MLSLSIRKYLLAITWVPLVILMTLVSLIILIDGLNDLKNDLSFRSKDISKQATLMSEFYFFTEDVNKLNEIADLLIGINDLNYIAFLDYNKNLLVDRSKENSKGPVEKILVPVYSYNINVNDFSNSSVTSDSAQIIGYIDMRLSKSSFQKKRNSIYRKVILTALIAMLVGAIFSLGFGKRLRESLSHLSRVSAQVSKNNLKERCPENGVGEILEVQQTFNQMLDALEENEDQTQQKISAATTELNATIMEISEKNKQLDASRQKSIQLAKLHAIAEERRRIMKDMHDGIGGHLVAALSLIEKESETALRSNVVDVISTCIDDLRLIIDSLNKSSSDLNALLADFKHRFQRRLPSANIELHWDVEYLQDLHELTPHQSLNILRIIQEACTNVIKHSGANNIYICAYESREYNIMLVVEDDGASFSCDHYSDGYGLSNMKARAEELNAQLNISCTLRGGCQVVLEIPWLKDNILRRL